MADANSIVDQAPLQDRDLLQRLSLYFDALDHRLRQGQGWFIFNAPGHRAKRIASFIEHRVSDRRPPVSTYFVVWRDFALSAYVNEVGLPEMAPTGQQPIGNERAKKEYELAVQVTRQAYGQMLNADLLVLIGLKPHHSHEAVFLDRTIEGRYQQRLATILMTPELPRDLEADYESVDPTKIYWDRLFQRMYETSLVAL